MKATLSLTPNRMQRFVIRTIVFFALPFALQSLAAEKISTWQTDSDGLWTDSYHWSTPSYPANSGTNLSTAIIDMPTRTITLDTSLTLESFTLSRGILSGSNAPSLQLNQQLLLGASQLINGGVLSANGMTVTGATKVVRGWVLENRGIANWLGGDFRIGDGARITNNATAGFNAACDASIINDLGGTATLENAGMFRKSAGTNQTKIYVPFFNTGSLEVDSGQLAFYGNSTNLGAHIEVLPNAAITFTGAHHLADVNSTITGDGGIIFDNGIVDLDSAINVKGTVVMGLSTVNLSPTCTVTQLGSSLIFTRSGTLSLNSGETISWNSLIMSNGLFSGSDSVHTGDGGFQWTGGTIQGSGHLDIDGDSVLTGGSKTLRGWNVQNHGAMQWTAGNITSGEGYRFTNLPGASLQTSFDGGWNYGYSGGALFANLGAFQKTGGTNATLFAVPVYNEGLVEVDSGTLRFANALTNSGALAGHSGTTFAFASPNIQLAALGSLDTDGTVVQESGIVANFGAFRAGAGLQLKSGSLSFSNCTSRPNFGAGVQIGGLATLNLSSGYSVNIASLFHTNGTITGSDSIVISNQWYCNSGDIDGNGVLELRGSSFINNGSRWTGRRIENYGDLDWQSGDLDAGAGMILHNALGGTFWVDSTKNFTSSLNGTAILNDGNFRKDSNGTNQIGVPLINNKSLYVFNGALQLNGGFTQTNGAVFLDGTAIGSVKPMMFYGGMINARGSIFASVFNAGMMSPGQEYKTGPLAISGNYTQAVTGILNIDVTNATDFDTLAIGGEANLGGTLHIELQNGFVPPDGASFPVLTYASRVGQFSDVTGGDLPNSRKLVPAYTATGMNLVVSNTTPLPQLTIERLSGTNAVKVSWAAGSDDLILQSQTNLRGSNWTDMPSTGTNSVIVPIAGPSQFFRLRHGP